jgi:hypothetical protein
MRPFVFLLLITIFIQSCKDNIKQNGQTINEVSIETALQIDYFTEWPEDIIGCSCYSSKNKEDFKKRQYLLIDDYFNNALININGNKETLNLVFNDTLNTKKERRKIWKNNQFELNLETYEIDSLDEIWVHEGVLKLTSKNGERLEMTIFGHCGC